MANQSEDRKPTDDDVRPEAVDELTEESLENVSGGALRSGAGQTRVQVVILQPGTDVAQVTPVLPSTKLKGR